MTFTLGQTVVTKKNHPCGGNRWEVVRTGADIKVKCLTCGRLVLLPLEKARKLLRPLQDDQTGTV